MANGAHALKIRVTTAPEKGKATAAVLALVAKYLGLKSHQVTLVSGEISRDKVLRLTGDIPAIGAKLDGFAVTG